MGDVGGQVEDSKGLGQGDRLGLRGFVQMDVQVSQHQEVVVPENQGGDCFIDGFQEVAGWTRRPVY